MDIMMPEMDGYQTMQAYQAESDVQAPAHHRADGKGDEGRPREMLRGGRVRLSRQAGQHRAAAVGAPYVAASIGGRDDFHCAIDKVNILLVDDQPAKLLIYEAILERARREPDQGQLGDRGARLSAQERDRRRARGRLHAGSRWLRARGDDSAASRGSRRPPIIFVSAVHLTDLDRLRGYECGAVDYVPVPVVPELLRAKVSVFAELYRKTRELER